MVAPDSRHGFQESHTFVAPETLADGVRDIPAAAPWPGHPIKLLDQLVGQEEVRAHTHAHSIAHNPRGVNPTR